MLVKRVLLKAIIRYSAFTSFLFSEEETNRFSSILTPIILLHQGWKLHKTSSINQPSTPSECRKALRHILKLLYCLLKVSNKNYDTKILPYHVEELKNNGDGRRKGFALL